MIELSSKKTFQTIVIYKNIKKNQNLDFFFIDKADSMKIKKKIPLIIPGYPSEKEQFF